MEGADDCGAFGRLFHLHEMRSVRHGGEGEAAIARKGTLHVDKRAGSRLWFTGDELSPAALTLHIRSQAPGRSCMVKMLASNSLAQASS